MLALTKSEKQHQPKQFGVFVGLLLLPLLFVAAAFSIPYGLIAMTLYRVREKRFAKRMAERGRIINFESFLQSSESGQGTVICEWKSKFKGPIRLWWTGDDLFADTPFPIVDREELPLKTNEQPFTRWCFDKYIDPSKGKALLLAVTKEQRKIVSEKLDHIRRVEVPTLTTEGW